MKSFRLLLKLLYLMFTVSCAAKVVTLDTFLPFELEVSMTHSVVFATFAEDSEQLKHTIILAESIRKFCGDYAGAPVHVYLPQSLLNDEPELIQKLMELDVRCMVPSSPNSRTGQMYFAGKVYAAAEAEKTARAAGIDLLIWVDEDTIFLQQPDCLMLPDNVQFGYRPVMHNRSGVAWGESPNPFWKRIYELLKIEPSMTFSMVAPADEAEIEAYFNAGLLVVRPGHGIMERWVLCFETLCEDKELFQMCMDHVEHRIFVHQTALVGAVLPYLERDQMMELPDTVNYPLFFDQMFKAAGKFESLNGKVSIRYDVYFRNPAPDWRDRLKGDTEIVEFLLRKFS